MLKIDKGKKSYKDFTLNCSLEVKAGCVTGLIGANGAGKSTTFKAILDLIHLDSGYIEILGKDVKALTVNDKQKLGVVLSDSGFGACLSIRDITCVLRAMYERYDQNKFFAACERFGLPLDKKIMDFSAGMKAKLKFLVALSHEAKLLILDEPTVGLDVAVRDEMLGLLREYMEEDEDRAILISSHISSDLEGLCDDIYMIHEGEIILHEETDVLLSQYALLKLSEEQFSFLDKSYILKYKKESYGYQCLTNQKQFYLDNYPEIVIEKGNIDDLIMLMIGGDVL